MAWSEMGPSEFCAECTWGSLVCWGGGGEMEGRRLVRDGCVRMLRRKFAVRRGAWRGTEPGHCTSWVHENLWTSHKMHLGRL